MKLVRPCLNSTSVTFGSAKSWLVASLFASSTLACAPEDKERPPGLPPCTEDCGGGALPGGSGKPGSNDGGASNGDGSAVTLEGEIVSFLTDRFTSVSEIERAVEVYGRTPSNSWVQVEANQGDFQLEGVARGKSVWVAGHPVDPLGYHSAFHLVDTTESPVVVPLVPRSLVEQIFTLALASESPEESAAQLVVRTVDEMGAGYAGVRLEVRGSSFVAYAADGTWSTSTESTTNEGLAFAGNIDAQAFPGKEAQITVAGTVSRSFSVMLARDSVTVVTIIVTP